jgi:hypothetical protein
MLAEGNRRRRFRARQKSQTTGEHAAQHHPILRQSIPERHMRYRVPSDDMSTLWKRSAFKRASYGPINKKKRPSPTEDERSWNTSFAGARMPYSTLRQPGYPPPSNTSGDPWLCVARFLWFCPFGDLSVVTDL